MPLIRVVYHDEFVNMMHEQCGWDREPASLLYSYLQELDSYAENEYIEFDPISLHHEYDYYTSEQEAAEDFGIDVKDVEPAIVAKNDRYIIVSLPELSLCSDPDLI